MPLKATQSCTSGDVGFQFQQYYEINSPVRTNHFYSLLETTTQLYGAAFGPAGRPCDTKSPKRSASECRRLSHVRVVAS